MKRNRDSSPIVRRVVAGIAFGVLVASCGSDSSSTATTSAATTQSGAASGDVCADREALSSSVDALKNVDVTAEGTNGLNAAVSAVKDDLTALRASAGSELRPQVDAVQSALDEVETAVANLSAGGAAPAVTAIATLASTSKTLLDSLEAGACGPSTKTT